MERCIYFLRAHQNCASCFLELFSLSGGFSRRFLMMK